MAITRKFKDTIMRRVERDPEFRRGMLTRGINYILTGDDDIELGKALIRDYVNATIGFDRLAEKTGLKKESLMRMLGKSGNPSLSNFNLITRTLLEIEEQEDKNWCLIAAE